VHSLSDADFERKDALSAHQRSRRAAENLLGAAGVRVTVIRAGIIVGHGGISWELTRQLVEHLPVLTMPRWVTTRTQPIAVDDVVRYLAGVLALPQAAGRALEAHRSSSSSGQAPRSRLPHGGWQQPRLS
jgi:uncharacterized protein YbjT (DUF2867 family)